MTNFEWADDRLRFVSKDGELHAEIDATPDMREEVFRRVVQFFADHECWAGESYMQTDAPQLDVHELMNDLLDDVLKPRVKYT